MDGACYWACSVGVLARVDAITSVGNIDIPSCSHVRYVYGLLSCLMACEHFGFTKVSV